MSELKYSYIKTPFEYGDEDYLCFAYEIDSNIAHVVKVRLSSQYFQGPKNVFEAWEHAKNSFIKDFKWWEWL